MAISSIKLNWCKPEQGELALHYGAQGPLLHIVPDSTYTGMWRIRRPDGQLSDMVNLSRAKDAGLSIGARVFEQQEG